MRAAIYARVSTRDGRQDTANQLKQLREFARRQAWQITAEYIDQESGARADRPEFRRMFAAAARREFDVLLFWALDRFSREGVLETLEHLRRLEAAGVRFRSYTEQYLDSCGIFREAVLSILATIAKQERIRISERTRAGMERARKAGRMPGRPRRGDRAAVRSVAQDCSAALGRRGSVRQIARSRERRRQRPPPPAPR